MTTIVEQIDAQVDQFLQGWNWLTTFLVLGWLAYLLQPLFFGKDPDTHPMLLARQANVDPVRQPGQSAFYKSLETPYGFPLKTGLNYKEPGATKWMAGKDGDVRDIWRQTVRGVLSDDGKPTGQTGTLYTVLGSEEVISHDLKTISKDINIIGKYIQNKAATCVAIYLPNSIELLVAVFAAAFYDFHPVLIPYNQPQDVVTKLLRMSNANYLIASAGSLPFSDMQADLGGIKGLMLVVEKSSRQMDWREPSLGSSIWHEIVEEQRGNITSDLPTNTDNDKPQDVITIWLNDDKSSTGEIVAFTQKNIVAAVAAQISAIPTRYKFGPGDLYLPADSLAAPHILIQTFAALYSNASIALNSVAGPNIDLGLAARGIAPTIASVSAATALKLHSSSTESVKSAVKKFALRSQTAALEAGYMPTADALLAKLNAPHQTPIGTASGKFRLLYVFERTNAGTPPLSSTELSNLRAYTGARVIYGLTSAKVAGTVAQTHFFDYRRESSDKLSGKHSHFGVAPSALALQVVDTNTHKTVEGALPKGELVAHGPAVANGTARLGVMATFRDDGTVAYV